jgi:hypothetical protein
MVLFDKILENADALRQVGLRALEDARKAGVAVAYMDPAFGDDIIHEFPDGRRERLVRGQNPRVVAIPPRT